MSQTHFSRTIYRFAAPAGLSSANWKMDGFVTNRLKEQLRKTMLPKN